MGTYPTTPRSDFLAWCIAHQDIFTDNAATIGLTAPQTLQFAAAITQYDSATKQIEAAREAAKAATTDGNTKYYDLREKAAEMVRSIRTFAENTNNPNVYSIAQVPPPADPSSIPAPGTPTNFRVELLQTGVIKLSWKCENPEGSQGTIYEVRRGQPGGPYTYVGANGKKEFLDTTLARGTGIVAYEVTARRSSLTGAPGTWLVAFGVGGGGGFTVTQIDNETRLAA